jgi:hypothetical protein
MLIQKAKSFGANYLEDCVKLLTSTDDVEVQKILAQMNASLSSSCSVSSSLTTNKNLLSVSNKRTSFSKKNASSGSNDGGVYSGGVVTVDVKTDIAPAPKALEQNLEVETNLDKTETNIEADDLNNQSSMYKNRIHFQFQENANDLIFILI